MLIDNLKDINSSTDLFNYVCAIEEQLETKTQQMDLYLRELDRKNTLVRRFAEEAGYKSIHEELPPSLLPLKTYIIKPKLGFDPEYGIIGRFVNARYFNEEGFQFNEDCTGWSVSFWKVLETD